MNSVFADEVYSCFGRRAKISPLRILFRVYIKSTGHLRIVNFRHIVRCYSGNKCEVTDEDEGCELDYCKLQC